MDEESLYEAIAEELENGKARKGLWTKAFAKSGGNDNAARALYIEYRITELKEEISHKNNELVRQRENELESVSHLLSEARQLHEVGLRKSDVHDLLLDRGLSRSIADLVVRTVFESKDTDGQDRGKEHQVRLDNKQELGLSEKNADASQSTSREISGLSGVGGWLLILVIGMLYVGPLIGAAHLYYGISFMEREHAMLRTLPRWGEYKGAIWFTFFFLAGLSAYGGWGLRHGKTWQVVRRAIIVLWTIGPIGVLLLNVFWPQLIWGEFLIEESHIAGNLVGAATAAGLWTWYLLRSKRVRNTYIKLNLDNQ